MSAHRPNASLRPRPDSTRRCHARPRPRRFAAVGVAVAIAAASGLWPAAAVAHAAPTRSPAASSAGRQDRPQDAGERATFGVRGATNGKVDERPYLTYGATDGGRLSDHVAIVNLSLRALTLHVYATDAINDANGDLTLLPESKKPTDAGSWIALGTPHASGRVRVAPRSMAIIPLHLHVPGKASPGDHVAGVVASLVASSTGKGVNVRLHQRVGMRVFVRISGKLRPGLSVERLSPRYDENINPIGHGQATVTYRVHNVGNIALGASQRVEVHGLFGQAAITPPQIPLLLPGASVVVRADVPGVLPELLMSAKVVLSPLVLHNSYTPGLASSYSASAHFWAVPWMLVAVVLAAALGVWWWRRNRRGQHVRGKRRAGTRVATRAHRNPEKEVVS